MIEKFILNEISIPDGVLHDQYLYNISLKDNELTLSFKIKIYPNDYTSTEFIEKYTPYTRCHIKCHLDDKMLCEAYLQTAFNKKNECKVKNFSIDEFVSFIDNEKNCCKNNNYFNTQYLYTHASPDINFVKIELCMYLKHKRTTYTTCTLELNTNEIEFVWE